MESIKKKLERIKMMNTCDQGCECYWKELMHALETAVEALEKIQEETKGTCVREIGCVDCESRNSLIKIESILNGPNH